MERHSIRPLSALFVELGGRAAPLMARVWPLAVFALAIVVAACSGGNGGSGGGSGY
jgi:hypothetical protein